MTVRSRLVGFSGATIASGANVDVYTVPVDRTLIVKDARLFCRVASPAVGIQLRLVSGGGTVVPIAQMTMSSGSLLVVDPAWVVALENFRLNIVNNGAVSATMDWCVSGALLDGDPA